VTVEGVKPIKEDGSFIRLGFDNLKLTLFLGQLFYQTAA
jgi:hypothetical protein